MSKIRTEPLYLRRIDAARNMWRYYSVSVQPTLFGDWTLVRHWGRIGTAGQCLSQTFDRFERADVELIKLEQAKRQRGYCEVPSVRKP